MKQNLLKTWLMLVCLLTIGGGKVWAETKTGSWDLTSTSTDWTASGNETYFSQPYGYKKANGTLTNKSISDFSTSNITQIKVGFKCLQNGATTSKLTIYLVDKDGKTLGSGVVVTPDNKSAASQTTYKYATFTTNLTGATGFMMKVTTFGKNILINGAEYEVTYTSGGGSTPTSRVDASWSISPESVSVMASRNATAAITTNYNGTLSVSSSNSSIATATISGKNITVKGVAEGSTTLTVTGAATSAYNAISKTINVTVSARPTNEIFYESFDTNTGTGGNDNLWNNILNSPSLTSDNTGWKFTKEYGANECARFGTASALGTAKTPALGVACNVIVTFKAAAWNGSNESTTLNVSANGLNGDSKDSRTVTLKKGEWTTYELTFTDLSTLSTIEFAGNSSSNSRFFLDEISIVRIGAPKALSSIAVKTAPTKVTYTEEEMFDPTGLVITATYDDENTEDIAYADNASAFSFNPSLTTPLTPSNDKVTITYKEKTCDQTITVNAIPTYTLTITQPTEGGTLTVKNGETTLENGASVRVGTNLTCEVTDIPEGKRFSRFYFYYGDSQNKYKATNPATFDELPTEGFTEATVTVTYQDIQYYTINYMINGVNTNPQENIEENTVLTFPTAPATIGDKSFVGWVEEAINGISDVKPALVSSVGQQAKANKTYYALYANKEGDGDPNTLTSVSGTITSGDYYLVDTYNNNGTLEYWAAQGSVSSKKGIDAKKIEDNSITLDNDILSIDLSKIEDANKPSLYTINIGDDDVVLMQGENHIYATYGTKVNADLASAETTGNVSTMNWNSIVGTGERHQIKAVYDEDYRILMLMDHTSSGNEAHYFKSYAETNSNTGGGAKENSYGSGSLYFLQAGAATYSDFTTAPLGTGSITVSAGGYDEPTEAYYATYYTDRCVTVPEGCEAASVDVENNKMYLSYTWTAGKVIPANTGVVIKADAAGTYTYPIGTEEDATAVEGTNYLKGSVEAGQTEGTDCIFYKLAKATDSAVIGFYWGAENGAAFNSGANKAYLAVPAEVAASIKGFAFGEADDATAIFETATDTNADNTLYNLNGQRVSKAQKGIYIVNGKKVMFK